MRQRSIPNTIGSFALIVAFILMIPIGYHGKDVASPWFLGLGAPLAWVGFAVLSWARVSAIMAVGGGFLVACVVAILGVGFGSLIIGHFFRDLLYVSPLFAMALYLRRRAAKRPPYGDGTDAATRQTPLGVLKSVVLGATAFGILMPSLLERNLLDVYPYPLSGLVGASLGYVLLRLFRPSAPVPYSLILCVAGPLGTTFGIFANRYWDSSAPTEHLATILDYENRSRGEDVCLVESWRSTWSERIGTSIVPCPANGALVVRTKSGRFGWPWIESARIARNAP